jgi:xanthosine utilization system XapX-like protein
VNAVFAFAATYVPDVLEWHYDVEFRPWQRLYAAVAMLAHAVGMLGPYDDTWWWDHVTHTLSSTLLSGVVHAVAHRRGKNPRPRVLAAIAVVGVVWELLEYVIHAVSERIGIDPLLVSYSRRDTLLDLVFNLVGAALVLAFGDRLLGNFIRDAE